jgi:hypothetical protein
VKWREGGDLLQVLEVLLFGLLDSSLLVLLDDLLPVAERRGRVVLDEVAHHGAEAVVLKHFVQGSHQARVVVVLGCTYVPHTPPSDQTHATDAWRRQLER